MGAQNAFTEGIRELERTLEERHSERHQRTAANTEARVRLSSYPPIARYQAPIGQRPANSGRYMYPK
jgi:hypothetical protein